MSVDFKEWNKTFDKLRYKHDTWKIFNDWLDIMIDQFTIPHQTPLFKHDTKKYTEKEYEYFDELINVYIQSMNKNNKQEDKHK